VKEPRWISLEIAHAVHTSMIAQHGGDASVRDAGVLESGLMRPRNRFNYGTHDIHELAAGYAFGVIRNHPFVDGNRRTGFMLAAVFLSINGWELTAPEDQAVEYTLGLAAHEIGEKRYAAWLRINTKELD